MFKFIYSQHIFRNNSSVDDFHLEFIFPKVKNVQNLNMELFIKKGVAVVVHHLSPTLWVTLK